MHSRNAAAVTNDLCMLVNMYLGTITAATPYI
jgi:hypothetical protein